MKSNSSFEELMTEAKSANAHKLSDLFRMNQYKYEEIDLAFRMFLLNYREDNEKYFKCLKLFIKSTNVNYQNSTKGNSTVLMESIRLGLFTTSEKLIKYFKSLDIDYKLDANLADDIGDTCLFKLITSRLFKNEDERYDLFNELITESPSIAQVNESGHTLLSLALTEGKYFISEELIKQGYDINHQMKSTGDNLLHCAVKGRNCLCVNLIKQHLPDGIQTANADGKLPIDIATDEKEESIINLLTESKKNYTQLELLGEYKKQNYVEALKALNVLKQNDRLGNLSLLWNNLLVEYKFEYFIKKEEQSNPKQKPSDYQSQSGNNIFTSLYHKVVKFFINEDKTVDHPIIHLNHIILKYKLGNYPQIIHLYNNYMLKSKKHDSYEHWLWFVIVSFILIEEFICINKIYIANHLLNDLTAFLAKTENQKASKTTTSLSSQSIIEDYLTSNQTLNQINNLTEVILLFTCYKLSAQGNINQAKSQLQLFKETYLKSSVQYPLQNTLKQFYSFLHIKVFYQLNQLSECNNCLNAIINDDNANFHSKLFYYNSIGILNLKQSHFKYAEFCFRQCDKLIKTEKKKEILIQNITNYKPCIWYNIGLCYFYNKNYDKSLKIFLSAKILKKCKPNPCLYYRIGICYLEKELAVMKKDSLVNSLNDVIFLIEDMSHKGEEEAKNECDQDNTMKTRKIILKTKPKDEHNENITEAINHFKEAIFLIDRKNTYTYDIYYTQKEGENEEDKEDLLSYEREVIQSSYLNLLFCLNLIDSWTEVVFYSNEYKQNKYYSKDIAYIIDNFLIEAFVNLNSNAQAIDLLQKSINDTHNISLSIELYSKLNQTHYPEVDYKIALYFNYIKILLLNPNRDHQLISSLVLTLLRLLNSDPESKPKDDYPPYVLSLLIYYLLLINKSEEAKHLIKHRTIPSFIQ